jgi:hypothetical protein
MKSEEASNNQYKFTNAPAVAVNERIDPKKMFMRK